MLAHALALAVAAAAPNATLAASAEPAGAAAERPTAAAAAERREVEGTYLELLDLVDRGALSRVDLFDEGRTAVAEVEDGGVPEELVVSLPGSGTTPDFIKRLQQMRIKINVHAHEDELTTFEVVSLISVEFTVPLLLTGTFFWLVQRSLGRAQASRSQVEVTPRTGVTFEDVAGVDEVRDEVMEVVQFLRSPERFVRLGARLPRGVLLAGPPGTGKTLLARALAGEAGVALIQASGASFREMYVGVGAARVRDVFSKAKRHAPCIVFIDEIDAIGGQRGQGGGSGEREQTVNQLLTEMDGFDASDGIIVLAATNRAEVLDGALLRPGRFDRRVEVGLPDVAGRERILARHAARKRLAGDVRLADLARRTPGLSGAQLANVLNEAAILAARRQRAQISGAEVDAALERVLHGIPGARLASPGARRIRAYHEAGSALVGLLLPEHEDVRRVTLVPRGQAPRAEADEGLLSRGALLARITGALAGRAAERLVFGERRVTSGARGGLARAERLARSMVTRFGMAEAGALALPGGAGSEQLAGAVDGAIRRISDECYRAALALLAERRACLDRIVGELVERETLSGARLREIVAECGEAPPGLSAAS